MDVLQEWFGADRMMADMIEHALLEFAERGIGAEIWEWGEVNLVLGIDLQPDEGREVWTEDGTNSLANCEAPSRREVGARQAPSSGGSASSTTGGTHPNSHTIPGSKWGRRGGAWHWKQNSASRQ